MIYESEEQGIFVLAVVHKRRDSKTDDIDQVLSLRFFLFQFESYFRLVQLLIRQHFLYFLPLPQGQGSLRPILPLVSRFG